MQEIFLSALRGIGTLDRPAGFKPWLYRIAHNACIDHMRRRATGRGGVDRRQRAPPGRGDPPLPAGRRATPRSPRRRTSATCARRSAASRRAGRDPGAARAGGAVVRRDRRADEHLASPPWRACCSAPGAACATSTARSRPASAAVRMRTVMAQTVEGVGRLQGPAGAGPPSPRLRGMPARRVRDGPRAAARGRAAGACAPAFPASRRCCRCPGSSTGARRRPAGLSIGDRPALVEPGSPPAPPAPPSPLTRRRRSLTSPSRPGRASSTPPPRSRRQPRSWPRRRSSAAAASSRTGLAPSRPVRAAHGGEAGRRRARRRASCRPGRARSSPLRCPCPSHRSRPARRRWSCHPRPCCPPHLPRPQLPADARRAGARAVRRASRRESAAPVEPSRLSDAARPTRR